ncbi:SpaA isopeptide-forming pilin-related protein [Faecalibacterium taiwanense]|uniref:LPXTG cell wall anchor domain-containing protein n=1 Tax=Faecalibacterium taiwanense TaxID=3030638 RepID=UPI003AABB012
MRDIVKEYQKKFRRNHQRARRYTALLLALALTTSLFVNWQLHGVGIAKTAEYLCGELEHEHTAACYEKQLVCGYEEGEPEDWNATMTDDGMSFDDTFDMDDDASGVDADDPDIATYSAEPEYIFVPHEHTDDCYQEVQELTCREEEHEHTDDCFDPEDGSLICDLFEHTHDDSCYTTTYELVCGLEEGELVEEVNPDYDPVALFEEPVAAKPVVVDPVTETPVHHHTDACYEEVLVCGLPEHHHTVNCLSDPLDGTQDEDDWLDKTGTALTGMWNEDLLTVAQGQLGYEQSEKNFKLDDADGTTVHYYTRYGAWYGNSYGSWDVMFLSYCLNYAGIPQSAIPQVSSVLSLHSQLRSVLYNEETGSGYAMDFDGDLPSDAAMPGDIVIYNGTVTKAVAVESQPLQVQDDSADADIALLSMDAAATTDTAPHIEEYTVDASTVGIVSDVDEDSGTLTVISGDVDGKVAKVTLNASQVTTLVSVANAQQADYGVATLESDASAKKVLDTMVPGGNIVGTTITVNNQTVTGDLTLTDGDKITLNYDYFIPADTIDPDGDRTLTYQLPEGLYLSTAIENRPIKQGDKVVGRYSVSKSGEVKLVFDTNFKADEYFVGSFGLEAKVENDKIGDNGEIKFPGTGITVTVKDKTDLSLKKSRVNDRFVEENGKVYAYYVIDVSSKQGWNEPITIHDEFNSDNTLGGTYDQNSFVLTDKSDKEIKGYTPDFAADGKSFDLKDLPALKKGEAYKLTYRVEITNNTKDGYGTFCNTAWVRENDKKTVYAAHDSYIKKASNYNPDDGYMYWTVTVYNPDGGDLNGKKLSDIIQTAGAEIVGNVTVTQTDLNWQQSEFDQITPAAGSTGFDYTFEKEAKGREYKFTYKTKVPDGVTKVENKSIIDDKYTAEETGTVTDRKWEVSKSTVGSLEETATKDLCKGAWSVSSPIPNNWSTCEFIDQIKKPKTSGIDHYGIASELRSEIEQNLSFTLVDGTPLNYQAAKAAGIGIAISYYGVEDPDKSDKPIQFTDDSSHVQSFKVTLSKGTYNGTAIKSMSISEYHTYMNVAGVAEGSKVEFTNKIKGGSSTKFTYEKKKPTPVLSKGVSTTGESSITSTGDGVYGSTITTGYKDDKDNYIYYQLSLNIADWTEFPEDTIAVTDTLDSRVTFVDAEATFNYGGNSCWPGSGSYDLKQKKYFSWNVSNNVVTFQFNELKSITETARITAIIIRYKVKVTDPEWASNPEKALETYPNTAAWGEAKASASATFTRKFNVLKKTGTETNSNNDSRAHYSIVINPTGKDLVPGADTITLTDTLTVEKGFSAQLDRSTLKLYNYPKQEGDTPLPDTLYDFHPSSSVNSDGQNVYTMTFVLPDERAFVLEYEYFTNAKNQKVELKNTAQLSGGGESEESTKLKDVNGWASVKQNRLALYKVDSDNENIGLAGAVFRMYKFDATTGRWDAGTVLPDTDATGTLSLTIGEHGITTDTLYKLVEESAPAGYAKTSKEFFFIWTANENEEKQTAYNTAVGPHGSAAGIPAFDASFVYKYNSSQELYIPNERNELTIQKFWVDENGKTLTGSEVTETSVSVQLYRYPKNGTRDLTDPVGEPITLTSANKWTYVYRQVDSGYYYFIQELGTGQQYDVIYSANNNPGVENGGLLTMTNKKKAGGYVLPSTGGAGTKLYTAGGGALMLAALVCGVCRKRRRERRAR